MRVLSSENLLSECSRAFDLPDVTLVEELVRPALRRAAYLLAPCSAADLVRFVADPLTPIRDLRETVEQSLEEMITYGDILEMRKLESDPWGVPSYVLRPAPPAFVIRSPTEAIIIGISGDLPSPLPAELASQVRTKGPVRVLPCAPDDHLAEHLKILGLAQLSEHSWLRTPTTMSAEQHVADWRARLAAIPSSPSTVDGLELLDPRRPSTFYKGRWRAPASTDSGRYVSRRTQLYGAKLWSLVEIEKGIPQRLLDLDSDDGFHRSCDLAWRLQAAIDAAAGSSQVVSVKREGSALNLDFQSPIPSFAERRLALVGTKSQAPGALFRFQIPEARAAAEIAALQSTLWMQPLHEGKMQ